MAKIVWTEPAIADLESIAGYIALDKPVATKRLVRQVFTRIEQLVLFPHSGGKPRDLGGTPYRQIVLPPLRIFYRMDGRNIFIIYVMRSERQFRLSDVTERER